jgi:hypothetical protein
MTFSVIVVFMLNNISEDSWLNFVKRYFHKLMKIAVYYSCIKPFYRLAWLNPKLGKENIGKPNLVMGY